MLCLSKVQRLFYVCRSHGLCPHYQIGVLEVFSIFELLTCDYSEITAYTDSLKLSIYRGKL